MEPARRFCKAANITLTAVMARESGPSSTPQRDLGNTGGCY
jgi:hypothetical protein